MVLTLGAALAFAQEALNNEGIIKLVKSGMSEELIANVIRQQPGSYLLGATDLVALKEAGVSEKLIAAMLDKAKPAGAPSAAPGAAEAPKKATAIPGAGRCAARSRRFRSIVPTCTAERPALGTDALTRCRHAAPTITRRVAVAQHTPGVLAR